MADAPKEGFAGWNKYRISMFAFGSALLMFGGSAIGRAFENAYLGWGVSLTLLGLVITAKA